MNYPSVQNRLIAHIIDLVIFAVVSFILGQIAPILGTLAWLAYFGYQVYFLSMRGGQTLGRQVMKYRVVKDDGSALTPVEVLIRIVCSVALVVEFYFIFKDPSYKAFHEKQAKTHVENV